MKNYQPTVSIKLPTCVNSNAYCAVNRMCNNSTIKTTNSMSKIEIKKNQMYPYHSNLNNEEPPNISSSSSSSEWRESPGQNTFDQFGRQSNNTTLPNSQQSSLIPKHCSSCSCDISCSSNSSTKTTPNPSNHTPPVPSLIKNNTGLEPDQQQKHQLPFPTDSKTTSFSLFGDYINEQQSTNYDSNQCNVVSYVDSTAEHPTPLQRTCYKIKEEKENGMSPSKQQNSTTSNLGFAAVNNKISKRVSFISKNYYYRS